MWIAANNKDTVDRGRHVGKRERTKDNDGEKKERSNGIRFFFPFRRSRKSAVEIREWQFSLREDAPIVDSCLKLKKLSCLK